MHFPPTQGKLSKPEHQQDTSKYEKYDFMRLGLDPEDVVRFVEPIVGREIPLIKPFDFAKLLTLVFFVATIYVSYRYIGSHLVAHLRNPIPWAIMSVVFTLIMTSGTMWNSIRGAPYVGNREVISGQFQSQFVIETRIVAILCPKPGLSLTDGFALICVSH